MSVVAALPLQREADRRWLAHSTTKRAVADRRFLLFLLCAVGIAFWFAVPYNFPLNLSADPLKAAASEAEAFQGSASRQIALPFLLLLTGGALLRLPTRCTVFARSRILLAALAYALWALASVVWSTDPQTTGKRLVVLMIDLAFCFAVARLTSLQQMAILGFVCTGIVALMAVFADVVLLRCFAPADPNYRFMGVMTANYQAMNLFVCLVCGLTLLQSRPGFGIWLAPLLSLFAILLFLTRARIGTILFLVAAMIFLGRMAHQMREQARALLVMGCLMLVAPGLFFLAGRYGSHAVGAAFMMGREDHENTASLSNRAPLWSELVQSARDRPLLGFGFDAFWTPERVEKVSLDQGWVVPHAHNTYLDQALSLGVPGALLYAACVWSACAVSWRRYSKRRDAPALLAALLLTWLCVLGLTESIPVAPFLPSLLAYSCVLKMCMSEHEADDARVEAGRTEQCVLERAKAFSSHNTFPPYRGEPHDGK